MKNILYALLMLILSACDAKNEQKTTIAILTPATHPSLEQIQKGFVTTMEAANPDTYRFIIYNAQGNKTLMRSEIEEIIQQKPALILTIGTSASQMATECFNKKKLEIPIVFASVNDPVGFSIVSSEEKPDQNVTGVKELLNFREELACLIRYKPSLKRVLLVYNPSEPGLQKDQKEVEIILKEKGILLTSIEVFQTNELLSKVSPFIEDTDAVIVLKDNTVVSGLDVIVRLCNRYRVPLLASDLDSPDKGAALAYGVYEIDFGIESAKLALQILNGKPPSGIPVIAVSTFTLKVNREAALKQGIDPYLIQLNQDK